MAKKVMAEKVKCEDCELEYEKGAPHAATTVLPKRMNEKITESGEMRGA